MRNKSGAGCRGARAKRARNDSPPRATLRYARTAMRNKSGAGCRGARAKRARNDSPPRATLRYARTAMRNQSGACPRGARAIAARNESTHALRYAPRTTMRRALVAPLRSAPIHAACLGRSVPLSLPSAPIHAARPRSPPRQRRRPIGGRLPLMGVGGAFCTTTAGGV